jgi:hypothetical protein
MENLSLFHVAILHDLGPGMIGYWKYPVTSRVM